MARFTINRTAQWYQDDWAPKANWDTVRKFLLHTTESTGWPGYADEDGHKGAKAPNATVRPDFAGKRLDVRQHFEWNASSRALRNERGGVETNAVPGGVTQIEIVGTCSRETSAEWQKKGLRPGVDYLESWDLPEWVIAGLAELWAYLHRTFGVPVELGSTHWTPYRETGTPTSAGASAPQRLHGDAWVRARGLVGHEHADEQVHGDPGDFPAAELLAATLALLTPKPAKPPAGTVHPTVQEAVMLSLLVRKPGTAGVSLVTPAGLAPVAKAQAVRHGVNLAAWPQGDVYELDASWPGWSLPNVGAHLPAKH